MERGQERMAEGEPQAKKREERRSCSGCRTCCLPSASLAEVPQAPAFREGRWALGNSPLGLLDKGDIGSSTGAFGKSCDCSPGEEGRGDKGRWNLHPIPKQVVFLLRGQRLIGAQLQPSC